MEVEHLEASQLVAGRQKQRLMSTKGGSAMRSAYLVLLAIVVLVAGIFTIYALKNRSKVVERRDVNIQEVQKQMQGRRSFDQPGLGVLGK